MSLVREFELAGAACVAVGVALGAGAAGAAVLVAVGVGVAVAVLADAFAFAEDVADEVVDEVADDVADEVADDVAEGVAVDSLGAAAPESVVDDAVGALDVASAVETPGAATSRLEAAFDSPIANVVPSTPKLRIAKVALVPYLTRRTPLSEFVRLAHPSEAQTSLRAQSRFEGRKQIRRLQK